MLSRLYLQPLPSPPATVLDHLAACFPHVARETWLDRFDRGLVALSDGTVLTAAAPYRPGVTVCYRRAVECEPKIDEKETILYRNQRILVVHKPHGMPVTPAGDYVERSLLFRLQRDTGEMDLAPAHRLDRETAGVVLFIVNASDRAAYHQLFSSGRIEREYYAAARLGERATAESWTVRCRIEDGSPWFVQRVAEGAPNSTTHIELVRRSGSEGLFRLLPETGRKHQLRLHMAASGYPISGDPLYPAVREREPGEPPLQLLAFRLAFEDPVDGTPHTFTSPASLHSFDSQSS